VFHPILHAHAVASGKILQFSFFSYRLPLKVVITSSLALISILTISKPELAFSISSFIFTLFSFLLCQLLNPTFIPREFLSSQRQPDLPKLSSGHLPAVFEALFGPYCVVAISRFPTSSQYWSYQYSIQLPLRSFVAIAFA